MMTIGTIIKEFRRQHNLTQAEFAKMTGVSSVAAVSRMEKPQHTIQRQVH
jgi:Predicted transcriptional regulators